MKTRIIQAEPEEAATAVEAVVGPTRDDRETMLRRAVVFTAVGGYFVLGILHPTGDLEVGDDTTLYLWLHLVQPLLILLLAWSIWLLVKDLPGRAALVARVAIVPYAIAYATLDAIAGIATGLVVREANGMSVADGAAVQRVLDGDGGTPITLAVYLASGLTWFVAALAAAIAVKQLGGLGPTLLMALGAAIFAVGHPFPPGPIGIALFGLGVAWLEVRRSHAPVPDAQPALVP
ncbi:MAG TPA: hypothetical protein VFO03_02285 [Gaiellaceae bacterium]|nr:hypothetical protein [Gaiellaceae bacterium]